MGMANMVKEAITDDNDAHDVVLWLVVGGCIALAGLQTIAVLKGAPFDASGFGTGFGSITGGGALGYAFKRVGEKFGTSNSNHSTSTE